MNRWFVTGRFLLGLCLLLDSVWNIVSYDVRVAYLDAAGAPHALVWLTVVVFGAGGAAIALGRRDREATFAVAAVILLLSLVLLTDPAGRGIGEYPPEFHGEVIFKEWLVHVGILGALLLVASGAPTAAQTAGPEPGAIARACGRAIIGGYFVANGLWQWWTLDIRVQHIVASGGDGRSLPIVIGLQLACGGLIAAGVFLRFASVPLMMILVLSTIVVHGNLSATAPYPPNAQVHQWFVKASILAGLLMVFAQGVGSTRRRDVPREEPGKTA